MIPSIDVTTLPAPAQRILDPASPQPMKQMAARGVLPGLKPQDMLAVLVMLSLASDALGEQAKKTLQNLPLPLINGALGSDELHPAVLDILGPLHAKDAAISDRLVRHPNLQPETVVTMASVASEGVCELIATNEERLLAHPAIIEKLYLNKATRMSTADRILELAVRNDVTLAIPAFEQAAIAIRGELVSEPTEEPTFDDQQFDSAKVIAEDIILAEGEDTHVIDEATGKEEVADKAKPLHAIWADLRPPAKIRLLQLASMTDDEGNQERLDGKALRMLGVRDANPLVAVAAIKAPGMGDGEVLRISGMRNVCEDVLREIAQNREWTRHYMIKFNLVANPRTPFGQSSKWIMHLRDNDLKTVSKSKEVPGAVQTAARQQLQRKGKQG